MEIRKYFEMNENENTTNGWDGDKVVVRKLF